MLTEWHRVYRQSQDGIVTLNVVPILLDTGVKFSALFWCQKHIEGFPLGYLHLNITSLAIGFKTETLREHGVADSSWSDWPLWGQWALEGSNQADSWVWAQCPGTAAFLPQVLDPWGWTPAPRLQLSPMGLIITFVRMDWHQAWHMVVSQ